MPTYITSVTETIRRQLKITASNTADAEKQIDEGKGEELSSNRTKNFVTRQQAEPRPPTPKT